MTAGDRLIVVAGEALVDLVLEPEGTTTPHLGGGPYNTARTIGRLGLAPVFVGRISTDVHGRALRAGLAQSDVRLDGVVDTDDPTTFALVELDHDGAASYRFYADGTSISGLLPEQARAAMPPLPAALHVGGLGLVFEPQARAIAGLVREAPSTTLVMLDPNCRPGAAPYPAVHRERLRELLARVDVVKASEEDLAYLEPEQPPLQTAGDLLTRGPTVVLVTQGSRGATVISPAGQTAVPAPPADVVDTIGAGDAFGGGWLTAWIAGGLGREDLGDFDAVVRTTRFAAQVAARTCEQAGAEPPYALRLDDEWCMAAPVDRSSQAARAD
ncbi:MAG TPA: carbohydrate kinase [Solirubrobacteraceae bacterium]|nr:carbohydrate kinase [Solirubrobacteraceae bacterium]